MFRQRVRHHLQPLLAFAEHTIVNNGRTTERVGLFVGATGGMRALLNQDDDPRKRKIETEAQAVIQSYNHGNIDRVDYQTISGRVEGVFGWVTANYDQGVGHAAATFAAPTQQINEQGIRGCGYVEMGGQTMQIAFHSATEQGSSGRVRIGADFNVVAYCWENRGADAAWEKHRDNLYDGSAKPRQRNMGLPATIDNCLPTGAPDLANPTPPPPQSIHWKWSICCGRIRMPLAGWLLLPDYTWDVRTKGIRISQERSACSWGCP